ncbi:hypothetical protein DPMN_045289 [Dreissena polymorpha]|uniref:Uncharacterized protein n=1 Tax=Dreissena polymorpha TaxID=45954 RepID=A0A9D4D5Z9_DREPO|nr:hypothetical protein DPMN_045289 [Dreissena polymorpha]
MNCNTSGWFLRCFASYATADETTTMQLRRSSGRMQIYHNGDWCNLGFRDTKNVGRFDDVGTRLHGS